MEVIQKQFTNSNVLDVIFANDLAYPQYPTSVKETNDLPTLCSHVKLELDRLKSYRGVSRGDPSNFCLCHYFVDSAANLESNIRHHQPKIPGYNYTCK